METIDYDFVREWKNGEEQKYPPLLARVGNSVSIGKDTLVDIADWKSPRIKPRIVSNEESFIHEITKISFSTNDERLKIEVLKLLHGVGYPVASCILHFRFPDAYTVIDFRAWDTLEKFGHLRNAPKDPLGRWWLYLSTCRHISKECGVCLRDLDRALWYYSKKGGKQ